MEQGSMNPNSPNATGKTTKSRSGFAVMPSSTKTCGGDDTCQREDSSAWQGRSSKAGTPTPIGAISPHSAMAGAASETQ